MTIRIFRRRKKRLRSSAEHEIAPDEIFLDTGNLPEFDVQQFEGRIERPISSKTIFFAGSFFLVMCLFLLVQIWILQVGKGNVYYERSARNSLQLSTIFASRGLIEDRNGVPLVSNVLSETHPEYPSRKYTSLEGFAHLLGYVSYPKKDSSGAYFRQEYTGKSGVEGYYDDLLAGQNGVKITETNVLGEIQSGSVARPPQPGMTLALSVDSRLQNELYSLIKGLAAERGFSGGAGALMDIKNGEIVALTSFPEFDSTIMSEGEDAVSISRFTSDERQPFLDRAVDGLYTPGSIIKPFIAAAALTEKIITPEKSILSTGSISIPNPYNPDLKSVFNDWRPQGWVNMRQALAVSSDVYFYEIGGGFEDQTGLGIARIKQYLQLFGFGIVEENNFLLDVAGTVPDPVWKAKTFNGEPWRIGDTYNTSIGQYGMQVTPIQALRATAAIANGGLLIEPTVLKNGNQGKVYSHSLGLSPDTFKVVQEGMRESVLSGIATNLNIGSVAVAAKTGTAELGSKKQYVNSWVEGFFPYENPKYAFVVMMERGPHDNTVGALYVFRRFLDWLSAEVPEYVR